MSLTAEKRTRPAPEVSDIVSGANAVKINKYYRAYFAEQDAGEGSPYRQDDHVGSLGWSQE